VSIGLVVIIDADKSTLQERLDWLALTLNEDSQENRQANEAIAIFVPKRNIETWIHYLQGEILTSPRFKNTGILSSCFEAG
jgi:hypothetical protein